MEQRKKGRFGSSLILRQILLMLTDVIVFIVTSVLVLLLRFEFDISDLLRYDFLFNVLKILPLTAVLSLAVFAAFGLYNSLWEFAGEREMVRIVLASAVSAVMHILILFMFGLAIPRSFVIMQSIFLLIFTLGTRFSYRLFRKVKEILSHDKHDERRTMIIGAGDAGAVILRELQRSRYSQSSVVCLIDDDINKCGKYMYGVPVVGTTRDIVSAVKQHKVEEIIFAIPSASAAKRSEVLDICSKTDCKLKMLPGIYQLVNGEVIVQKIRDVQIEDLLARESIRVNIDEIAGYVRGKTVLVTGGGGSIGSELCRQIATHEPDKLIIFDIYENNAYAIQQELHRNCPQTEVVVLIGSVRDQKRVESVFEKYHPNIVFHAAAHKHVPLMETSPGESIKNNVFGTWNVASAADQFCTDTFVLISTDKAVNPTNIMGASKRLCEMIICDFAGRSDTKYACVRFGNVLGSNGSVIPLFKEQILAGGPVTVTHKDIIRYFMTIPEAVSLVLQAGSYAENGEIFVLDMGEPVRIDDLARNMIRLSGLKPDEDIKIVYTGLRPGEKLYEELLLSGEGLVKTPNDLIFVGRLEPIDSDFLKEKLYLLRQACEEDTGDIKQLVHEIVPEYSVYGEIVRS